MAALSLSLWAAPCYSRASPPGNMRPLRAPRQAISAHRLSPPNKLAIIAAAAPDARPPSATMASIAACLLLSVWATPAQAGFLSGSPGLESLEFPSLPQPENLKKIQEENRKMYQGYDAKFKSSPLLQELLKRSKENSEKHKQEIQNKYCERGADWGVGDCSLSAMSEEERARFMEALKENKSPD